MFPFPLLAVTRNSLVNLAAQAEQDGGNSAARGIAVRQQEREDTFRKGSERPRVTLGSDSPRLALAGL